MERFGSELVSILVMRKIEDDLLDLLDVRDLQQRNNMD